MTYSVEVKIDGESRSFPGGEHPFTSAEGPAVLVLAGQRVGERLTEVDPSKWVAVLIELGTECLGVHTGEIAGTEGSNILGFARWRMGDDAPTQLVELVHQPGSDDAALSAAREVLTATGFQVSVCADRPGRILDRMLRPHFNAALQALDEGLASAEDMDLTVKLGLGHGEGPIGLLERSGLAHHFTVSAALFKAYGEPSLVPARRAVVAHERARDRQDRGV